MRGRPWLEVILFALAWSALAIPLWHLTAGGKGHGQGTREERQGARQSSPVRAWASLRFAQAPDYAVLRVGTQALLSVTSPVPLRVDADVLLPLVEGHVVVTVDAGWPPGVEAGVVELTLKPDGLPGQARHAWGTGALSDTWEFQWTP